MKLKISTYKGNQEVSIQRIRGKKKCTDRRSVCILEPEALNIYGCFSLLPHLLHKSYMKTWGVWLL